MEFLSIFLLQLSLPIQIYNLSHTLSKVQADELFDIFWC